MVYIIPFLAVILGYLVALFIQPKSQKNVKLLMVFSSSFLLALTVTHLLPDVYQYSLTETVHHFENEHNHSVGAIGFYIMFGIVLQIILEYFSKGAEHGHVHLHDKPDRIPWLLFISLCLHALLEGLPVNRHHELSLGIAIHHLPIAVILSTFFIRSGMSKKAVFFCMFLFALMTPTGTFMTEKLDFLQNYYAEISAVVVGILFHISSTIIFESNENHKFNISKLIAIIAGVLCTYFV